MTARGAAALLVLFTLGLSPLQHRWLHANRQAKAFDATITRIVQRQHAPVLTDRDPHELAGRILNDRHTYSFAPQQTAPKTWWDRLWSWIAAQWDRFWNLIFSRVHVSTRAGVAFGDLLLVLSALLVGVIGVRLFLLVQFGGTARPAQSQALRAPADGAELYRQSCEAARRGAYADAISKLFLATLRVMDPYADADPGRTVGEFRRDLCSARAALVPGFDIIAQTFTAGVYAERPLHLDDWLRARDAYVHLQIPEPLH
ncbi:MAG: hypothetical protein ABI182_02025 [Candidatus Baltobacteraceae bacterium]